VGAGQQRSEAAHITSAKVPCNEWGACHASMVTPWKPQRKVTDGACRDFRRRPQENRSSATRTLGESEEEQGCVNKSWRTYGVLFLRGRGRGGVVFLRFSAILGSTYTACSRFSTISITALTSSAFGACPR